MSANKRIKRRCMAMVLLGVTAGMTGVIHAEQASMPQGTSAAPASAASATPMAASAPAAGSGTATSAAVSASAPQPASAASGASAAAAAYAPKQGKSTTVRAQLEAKVLSIDANAGSMVARGKDGIERHFVLDTQVREAAAKIKAGDRVKVLFDRSIRLTLKGAGEKASTGVKENEFDATVVAVNRAAHMVSIKGPNGNVFDIDVERAEVFDAIHPNSVVHVEFGRPVALSVIPG